MQRESNLFRITLKQGNIESFMPKEGRAQVLNEMEFKRLLIIAKDGQFPITNVGGSLYMTSGHKTFNQTQDNMLRKLHLPK